MKLFVVAAALVALVLVGCGHYGPPRRTEPVEPVTPVVVVTPVAGTPEPATPETHAPGEPCEAPPP